MENEEREDNEAVPFLPTKDAETSCGMFGLRPRCLQIFAKPIYMMILLNIYCLLEAIIVTGLVPSVLSSLETRYKFSSIQLGMVSSTFDFTGVVTVIFISYFATKSHKPRWLGAGAFFLGIGSLLFASPQFFTGTYDTGKNANATLEACRDKNDFSPDCDKKSDDIYFMFILSMILIGIGGAPVFTVGTSFIDDIIHPKYVPICLGIFFTMAVLGPPLGFGIGGLLLKIYVDPWKKTTLGESDPGWVGAWWMALILVGVVSLLTSIPFFLFPKKFSNTDFVQQERIKRAKREGLRKEDFTVQFSIKKLPQQIIILLGNTTYLFVVVSHALMIFIASGFLPFLPKYMEAVFGLNASSGSLATGATGITTTAIGIMLGALLVHFKKPTIKNLTLNFAMINIVTAVFLGSFFLRCSTHDIAGVTVDYPNSTLFDDQTLNATCNSDCDCRSTIFEPVCSDGITYFSPCRAGCDKYYLHGNRDEPRFENCTCSSGAAMARAKEGYCNEHCKMLVPFLITFGLMLTAVTIIQIPTTVIVIRCISDEQRTLALGLQSVLMRIIGNIPGPIVVGALFDSSCLYWQEQCGDKGKCYIYDNNELTFRLFSMTTGVRILSILFSFCAWIFFGVTLCNQSKKKYNPVPLKQEEEETIDVIN